MGSTVSSKGESSFELVPPGTHYAVCTKVLNLGQQTTKFGRTPKHFIGFEIPAVRVEWEKDSVKHEGPGFIGSRYTSSLSPRAIMRQHLESWRGQAFTEEQLAGFDLFNLLGVPAMLAVTHTEDGKFANIAAIMGMPPGSPQIVAEGELIGYDPEDPQAIVAFGKLSEGFQKTITAGQAPDAVVPVSAAATHASAVTQQTPTVHPVPGHQAAAQGPAQEPTPPPIDDFEDDIPF